MKKIIKTILVLTVVFSSGMVGDINKVFAEEVDIPDASFRACLNNKIGQQRDAAITEEQLGKINYELKCKGTDYDEPIKDITGIEYTNTISTYFYANEIVDFSLLGQKERNTILHIEDNPAIDFDLLKDSKMRNLSLINS